MKMRTAIYFLLFVFALPCSAVSPGTMRLDYFHTGGMGQEIFSLDRVVVEPLPWPGNPNRLTDSTNRGTYFFEVRDLAKQRVLYSRGFSSIYGEWITTDEAKKAYRTFHESLRFPAPESPVEITVLKRDAQNAFREIWRTIVDPKDKQIDASTPPFHPLVLEVEKNGGPALKLDLLFLGEGYSSAEQDKCERDIRRLTEGVFSYSPFKERHTDFNVWAICAASPDSGVSHPASGVHKRTLYGTQFDVFGEDRYALSFDNQAIRIMASFAPYDAMGIVMNSKEYGNGGVFGLYATVSIDYPNGIQVFVHEFGHHIADLGDEYYFNADVAYSPASTRVEPWEPNVTALLDPHHVKWQSLVKSDTPIPTPWLKDCYENSLRDSQRMIERMRKEDRPRAEIGEARKKAREQAERCLSSGPYVDTVGAFEGAMYETKGYYRPQQQCIMISGDQFCAVCRRAIEEIIDLYSRP
jgi:IgA Peptidase M64/Peptidase M64 N-terminus